MAQKDRGFRVAQKFPVPSGSSGVRPSHSPGRGMLADPRPMISALGAAEEARRQERREKGSGPARCWMGISGTRRPRRRSPAEGRSIVAACALGAPREAVRRPRTVCAWMGVTRVGRPCAGSAKCSSIGSRRQGGRLLAGPEASTLTVLVLSTIPIRTRADGFSDGALTRPDDGAVRGPPFGQARTVTRRPRRGCAMGLVVRRGGDKGHGRRSNGSRSRLGEPLPRFTPPRPDIDPREIAGPCGLRGPRPIARSSYERALLVLIPECSPDGLPAQLNSLEALSGTGHARAAQAGHR